jgi:hypothetical protein
MLQLARWPVPRAGILEGLARSLVAAAGSAFCSRLLHAYSAALQAAAGEPRPPGSTLPPPPLPLRDTIFALSSGPVRSAVAVVRISGPDSGGQGPRSDPQRMPAPLLTLTSPRPPLPPLLLLSPLLQTSPCAACCQARCPRPASPA